MNETEERTGLDSQRVTKSKEYGHEEEEPPGKPRRHPLWRHVPKKQWDDWRWQAQNAIRSIRQLRELLLPKLMSGQIRLKHAEKQVEDTL